MTQPRFPLKMSDGSEVRSLEELREHADLAAITARFDDGALRRWLRVWGFIEEAEKVEELDSAAEGFHKALYDALGIPWTKETDAQLMAYVEAEIERELAENKNIGPEEVDETTTDEIAQALMQMADSYSFLPFHSEKAKFVESENYILCAACLSGPWYRIEKKTGLEQKVELEHDFYDCSICGDMLYAMDNRNLVSLNLETLEEEVVMDMVCPGSIPVVDFNFAPLGTSKMIAYSKSNSLFLFDCETKAEINLIHGGQKQYISRFASTDKLKANMVFTEDALYFDYNDPKETGFFNGLYRYDIRTQKYSVLLSEKDIPKALGDDTNTIRSSVSAIVAKRGTLLITNISGHEKRDLLRNLTTKHPYWAKLVLSADGTSVEIEKTQDICYCAYCMQVYEDGFLYITERENHELYLSFVNIDGEEKSFLFWKPENEQQSEEFAHYIYESGFRLGKYFYYSVHYEDSDRSKKEIWKISLETGEQVKLPCGD